MADSNGSGGQNFSTAFTDAMRNQPPPSPPPPAPEPIQQPVVQQTQQPIQPSPQAPLGQQPSIQPSVPSQSPWEALFQRGQEFGLTGGDPTKPHEFVEQLLNHTAKTNQALAYASSLIQHGQQPPQQQPPPPESKDWDLETHFGKAWNLPKYNQNWDRMISAGAVQKDASGQWVPAPGHEWMAMNPELAALNQFSQQQQVAMNDLFYGGNFYKKVYDTLQEPISRMLEEKVNGLLEQRTSQQRADTMLDQIERQYGTLIYSGQQFNPITGQMEQKFSEYGQKLVGAIQDLETSGVGDPATRLSLAMRFMPPPAQANGASAQGNGAAPTQQGQQPFLKQAMEMVQHRPAGGQQNFGVSANPGQQTDAEIKSMFVRKHAEISAA